jgi:hypothetical protein
LVSLNWQRWKHPSLPLIDHVVFVRLASTLQF